uniref:Hyaluronan and proteoglycan link protein 3 n=1 Tax=Hucho hucho TaxID=62062 RepID=A0A4W5LY70_9TELE
CITLTYPVSTVYLLYILFLLYKSVYFNGVRLHVESPQPSVSAARGSNVTLPCHYRYEPEINGPRRTRVKWSWLPTNGASKTTRETNVMVAMGNRHRSYGSFQGRVRLRRAAPGDMSLVIKELHLNDTGRYRCEVIDGLEDESVTVELELRGVCVCVCLCLCVYVSRQPPLL